MVALRPATVDRFRHHHSAAAIKYWPIGYRHDFDRIIITYLDEMKEWFDNRVGVVKDSSGSHLRLVTA